jgi:hypothetical protein
MERGDEPRDGLVVIAEDLSQQLFFVRLDDGFRPARPGKLLKRGNRVSVRHHDELGLIAPAAPTPVTWEHPACASTMGTPVSRTKRSNSSSFPG